MTFLWLGHPSVYHLCHSSLPSICEILHSCWTHFQSFNNPNVKIITRKAPSRRLYINYNWVQMINHYFTIMLSNDIIRTLSCWNRVFVWRNTWRDTHEASRTKWQVFRTQRLQFIEGLMISNQIVHPLMSKRVHWYLHVNFPFFLSWEWCNRKGNFVTKHMRLIILLGLLNCSLIFTVIHRLHAAHKSKWL